MPKTCPNCKSSQIRAYGLGSEKVETELTTLLPKARPLRWDWETTREKDAHELILTHFANHQADVLVGTQMLAKGLDLPLVTLVGIVLADVGLSLPDPFAAERSFQLLTQVAGRAGRSPRGGKVILQTFMPEHPVIQMASRHDYAAFYNWEIENRRKLGYPPFGRLVRLEYRHRENAEAEKQSKILAQRLTTDIKAEKRTETDLIGPVPCFFMKINGIYRWQIVLRGPDPVTLLKGKISTGWRVEVDPISLL
jgi:primosomal protein N' (replication factor Y)